MTTIKFLLCTIVLGCTVLTNTYASANDNSTYNIREKLFIAAQAEGLTNDLAIGHQEPLLTDNEHRTLTILFNKYGFIDNPKGALISPSEEEIHEINAIELKLCSKMTPTNPMYKSLECSS